jgi:mannose/fructose/N-acetylgalactosamine-specific phosphotransferase system component IIC
MGYIIVIVGFAIIIMLMWSLMDITPVEEE